jgi:hypothetical protein
MYVNLDLGNGGGNPVNAQLIETTSCLRVTPFKYTPTSKTWTPGSSRDITIYPSFDVWYPSSSYPSIGAITLGQDLNNESTANDLLFALEVTFTLHLANSA